MTGDTATRGAPTTRRIQLLTRPWGASGEALEPSCHAASDGRSPPEVTLHLVLGVVEVPPGLAGDELRGLGLMPGASYATLNERGAPAVDAWGEAANAADEVTSALGLAMWRLPASRLPGVLAGLVMLRPCALEAAPGLEAALLCGILGSPPGDADASLSLDGAGEGGRFRVAPSALGRSVPPPGAAPAHAFETAQWGWGTEPVGFASTMGLAAQDALDAARALPARGRRTEAQEAEWWQLSRACGGACQATDHDATFAAFAERMAREPGVPTGPTRVPRTASEFAAVDAAADRVMREVLGAA